MAQAADPRQTQINIRPLEGNDITYSVDSTLTPQQIIQLLDDLASRGGSLFRHQAIDGHPGWYDQVPIAQGQAVPAVPLAAPQGRVGIEAQIQQPAAPQAPAAPQPVQVLTVQKKPVIPDGAVIITPTGSIVTTYNNALYVRGGNGVFHQQGMPPTPQYALPAGLQTQVNTQYEKIIGGRAKELAQVKEQLTIVQQTAAKVPTLQDELNKHKTANRTLKTATDDAQEKARTLEARLAQMPAPFDGFTLFAEGEDIKVGYIFNGQIYVPNEGGSKFYKLGEQLSEQNRLPAEPEKIALSWTEWYNNSVFDGEEVEALRATANKLPTLEAALQQEKTGRAQDIDALKRGVDKKISEHQRLEQGYAALVSYGAGPIAAALREGQLKPLDREAAVRASKLWAQQVTVRSPPAQQMRQKLEGAIDIFYDSNSTQAERQKAAAHILAATVVTYRGRPELRQTAVNLIGIPSNILVGVQTAPELFTGFLRHYVGEPGLVQAMQHYAGLLAAPAAPQAANGAPAGNGR